MDLRSRLLAASGGNLVDPSLRALLLEAANSLAGKSVAAVRSCELISEDELAALLAEEESSESAGA
jgi:hypothetical protein